MPEDLKPCCIIVNDEEILFALVIFFVFELEFQTEDSLLRFLLRLSAI